MDFTCPQCTKTVDILAHYIKGRDMVVACLDCVKWHQLAKLAGVNA